MYNVGSGEELTIKKLANLIKKEVGYNGKIVWDEAKPNGTPRKFLDSSKLNDLGWKSKIKLTDGISKTYENFLSLKLN